MGSRRSSEEQSVTTASREWRRLPPAKEGGDDGDEEITCQHRWFVEYFKICFSRCNARALLLVSAIKSKLLHFYAQSCPRAETIVRQVVQHRAAQDRSVLPALIRLQFHDCFVRGCDGSVLIDSAGGNVAEKEADPNLTPRMLDVIDDVKAALETACPGVVSCADIIGLAARDAAAMAGRVRYQLPTGRRDGTVSSAAEVHLPSPSVSFADALSAFSNIGLDVVDLTTLLGSHTMGFCHCMFVMDRLYDFKKTGTPDQTMDAGLRASLQGSCPPHTVTP
ncbi:hypothetical protein QYE76_028292 [Lolium multiflorum]|uniref:peroxidase n=1 Tax=Lolium multiflorum TaxID=4521 RepID=A0AAD8QP03_LOLMU|nr:hypothetical protein QYE76_028292 [Lolium multiflorum]